jgi:hypothetical protein
MRKPLLWGIDAGAVGTVALDAASYLDMVVRARPASSLPAEVAGALADRAGVELAAGGNDSEPAGNRRSGLGALLGYGVGLGVGGAYGLLRARLPGQLPHLAYGLATATVYEALAGPADPRLR